jgi:triacylglycerol lipase
MIGRRSILVLSLLCALFFCVSVAQSAAAKGTTAVTCSSNAGVKDFSDGHCDSGTSEGSFGHIEIEEGQETEVQISNAKTKGETKEATPAILKGTIAGAKLEISCTTVGGSAKLTNKQISEVMQNEGTGIAISYTGCTVLKPTKGCKVKEPFEVTGTSITVENLAGKSEMGVEVKPKEFKVTLEGAECGPKGTFTISGTVVGTGPRGNTEGVTSSGGTLIFTNEMTKETLKLAGNAAELSSTITISRKDSEAKPITLTTFGPEESGECAAEPEWPEEEICNTPEVSEEELEKNFKPGEECPAKKAGEASALDPIVFVHGWNGSVQTFKTMRKKFKEEGWEEAWLCNYKYRWWKPVKESAETLKAKVEFVLKETGAKQVDIVSHSLGGIVSRYYIKELKEAGMVNQWVSLAAPNRGTWVALLCFATYVVCPEMLPGSNLLNSLNKDETPAGPKYATWRSGFLFGVIPCDFAILPPGSAELGGTAKNTMTGCLGHGEIHEDKKVFEEVRNFVK